MSKSAKDYQHNLEMRELAMRLASYGFIMKLTEQMTGVKGDILKKSFKASPGQSRSAKGWLNSKGGDKTNADRMLRFLLKAHGSDLSTLNIDDPRLLLQYYETYIASHPAGYVDICRFYYFALDLVSNIHPVMKCSDCNKPFVTLDARIKDCGICNDIKSRINHMKKFRKRRKAAMAKAG